MEIEKKIQQHRRKPLSEQDSMRFRRCRLFKALKRLFLRSFGSSKMSFKSSKSCC